jgi:hypothetical protein
MDDEYGDYSEIFTPTDTQAHTPLLSIMSGILSVSIGNIPSTDTQAHTPLLSIMSGMPSL